MRALIVLSSLVITLILVSVSVLLLGPQTPSNDQLDVKTQIYSHMCVSQHKVGPAFGIGELRASYTLPVRNWWSETIHIKKIVSSCSCTSAKLRDEVLAPGAETMLDVLVSHPSTGGDANISCRLIADNGKELLHRFRSVAYPLVQLDTKTGSVGFGEVNPGTQLTDSVSLWLYRPPMQSWPEIISVSSDSPSVNVEVSKDMECSELDNESGQRARLSLTMRVDAGSIPATRGATIDVQYRVGEQLGSTKIPVTWKVKPILGATPERLFISIDGKVDRLQRALVRIRSLDNKSFRLVRVEGLPSEWKARFDSSIVAQEHQVEFEMMISSPQSAFHEVLISTNHPVQSELFYPLSIRVIEP